MQVYHGQFVNPQVDEYLHKTFFNEVRGGICIEAGAYDGVADSNTFFFEKHLDWTAVNIEPSPTLFQELVKNRPNCVNLHNAITSQSFSGKEVTFEEMLFKYKDFPIGHGYIDEITTVAGKKDADKDNNKRGSKYPVTGISYKDLVEHLTLDRVDLFILDIEGGEEAVLKDLYLCPVLPKVLCIEDNFSEILKFKRILEPLGYKFHSRVHVNDHFVLS